MAIDWNTATLPAVMDRKSAAGIEQETTDGHDRREQAERFGKPDEGVDTSQPVEGGDARATADLPERERNHRIGNEPLAPAGQVGKIKANLRAMEMLRALESEGRHPTAAERQILAQYTGWGHSPQVFDEIKAGYWKAHLEGESSYGYKQDPDGLTHWAGKFYEHHRTLKEMLTPQEWSRAEASTLNAHYTSREVIEHGLWAIALHLGFKGGRVLENSAGIGHVIGLVPDNIAGSCHFTACELDTISGRMLKLLYPQATVHVTAFQDATIAPESQDLTIGNFPFNKEGWSGEQYPFSLHNQFFARSFDLTAPGGLIVAITSNSTMDSPASASFRRWMAQRADLVGAIRLPNNTFKKNAGTEVTTDILVFRKHDGQPFEHCEGFITTLSMETGKTVASGPETVEVNEYFHRHPDMMLGRMTREGSMYEADSPALIAHPGRELVPQLQEAVRKLPAGIARQWSGVPPPPLEQVAVIHAEPEQKEGSYQIRNGRVYQVQGGELTAPDFGDNPVLGRQARHWIALREAAKTLFARELDARAGNDEIEMCRRTLWRMYDGYVRAYGRVNKSSRHFLSDPESSIPAALENEVTQKYRSRLKSGKHVDRLRPVYMPADILSRRVLYPSSPPARAESVADAVTISRSWRGTLDLDYMASLLGKSQDNVREEVIAKGLGFEDPTTGRVMPSDEYLSGNVREKLRVAEEAAAREPRYKVNVEPLREVQPQPLKIHQIRFSLAATWMPTRVVEGWLDHLFYRTGAPGAARVIRVPETGRCIVQWDTRIRDDAKNTDTHAGGGVKAAQLIEDALNLKLSIAYDEEHDPSSGKTRYVKNPQRTAAAQDAQQKLKDAYYQWARRSDFTPEIEAEYNAVRNAYRQRHWEAADFRHFPNASNTVELRPHQKTSVARNMVESNLMAHPVGSGKTYVYATTAMEWKRLGLANKPVIAVLKSTLGQVEHAFRALYPQARLLVPREMDFSRENRQKLLARIATSDCDAIILTHDNLNGIPDDPQRERNYINDRIAGFVESIRKATELEGGDTHG